MRQTDCSEQIKITLDQEKEFKELKEYFKKSEERLNDYIKTSYNKLYQCKEDHLKNIRNLSLDIRYYLNGKDFKTIKKNYQIMNFSNNKKLFPLLKLQDFNNPIMFQSKDKITFSEPQEFEQTNFFKDMIFADFYYKKIDHIIIEMDYDDQVIYTKLLKEDSMAIGEILEKEIKNYELIFEEGEKCPIRLFTGEKYKYNNDYEGFKVQWWINREFKLGGGVYYYDDEGNYQLEEVAAIGLDEFQSNGVRLMQGVYPHQNTKIEFRLNLYGY